MKKKSPENMEDFDAKILAYVEDALSPEEREEVEAEMRDSEKSFKEVKELDVITSAMKFHKLEIFCPEPWELYEYASTKSDPSGVIARHVESCPECLAEVESFATPYKKEAMTSAVQAAFRDTFSQPKVRTPAPVSTTLTDRIKEFFSWMAGAPLAPLATAAAVAVLVIMVFPRGGVETTLGLSQTAWTQDKGVPKTILKRPRAAAVIALKGFDKPMDPARLDEIYKRLEPSGDVQQRIELVSPTKLSAALGDMAKKPLNQEALTARLKDDLNVSRLLIVTVSPSESRFNVSGELIDLKSGAITKGRDELDVSGPQLPDTIAALSSILYY